MKKKFIAYSGDYFTIEWYFDGRERCHALDYFEDLTEGRKDKLFYLFRQFGDMGKIYSPEKFRYEGDKIYAFKPAPDRFLCFFFEGSKIVVTNAYEKKTDKMPPREKQKALKAMADYIERCKKGTYYDKKN